MVSILGVGIGPLFLELGTTHLFNPRWPPHARFHLVWFACSNALLALLASTALWGRWPDARRGVQIAGALNGVMLAGFFVAALLRPIYAGALVE
ncbi:MAG: DUF6640 family protein, partial [Myxococcota bacterium]